MLKTISYLFLLLALPLVAAENARMIYEPVFDDSVYFREAGLPSAQSVVLVHGVGAEASAVWDDIIPVLSKKYHVLAFDLPGFGKSQQKNALYSPDRYAEFIRWIVDEYASGPIYLIGHSMGGGIALCYAGTYPKSVRKLVLVDLYGVLHRKVLVDFFTDGQKKKASFIWKGPIKILSGLMNSVMDLFSDKSVNKNIDQTLNDPLARQTTLGGKAPRIAGLALVNYDFSWTLDRVSAQTLVLWGSEDPIAPLRTALVLTHRIPHSRLEIVPNAGHSPMLDQAPSFRNHLLHFLQTNKATNFAYNYRLQAGPKQRKRVAHYLREYDQIYTGDYDTLTVRRSKRVLLDHVQAAYIDIRSSLATIRNSVINGRKSGVYISAATVTMENCIIKAKGKALQTRGAELTLTACTLSADTAIASSRSRFNIAGSELYGTKRAITADIRNHAILPVPDRSDYLFSVTKIRSGNKISHLHGTLEIGPRKPY